MKAIHLIPAATAALLLVAGGAQAQSVNSGQRNQANVRAQLNAVITNVNDDVTATSAAIGNSLTIEGHTATGISNNQFFTGEPYLAYRFVSGKRGVNICFLRSGKTSANV